MSYSDFGNYTRSELIKKVKERVSKKRYEHMLAVEKAALYLAEKYEVDKDKAGLAALLHDYAKELPDELFLDMIERKRLDPELKKWGNNIWHGLVGVYFISSELGINDNEILEAIALHTTGSKDMSDLDKVVYLADYIEESRNFPGVDEARRLAEISLDKAVAYETAHTISYLVQNGIPIYPKTLETYNEFIKYLNE